METPQTLYTIRLHPTELSHVEALADRQNLPLATHSSVEEFLQTYRPGSAGCIVMDVGASGEKTLAELALLRERTVLLPTVIVAERPSVALAVRAVQQGAATVLEKPTPRHLLEQAVEDALRQDAEDLGRRLLRETTASRLATLNEGERQVLQRLMDGMANKNIAADLKLGLRTVELRRAKILKKLGAKSLAEMVRLVVLADPDRWQRE
jgi:two-component system CheB/CheR fusion protein